MITLIFILSLSIMFLFLKHPLTLGFTLLMQSLLIAMTAGYMSYNFWFSYILFLIMVGGMLVLFIYMTSIASNEMFHYSNKITMMMVTLQLLLGSSYLILDNYLIYQNMLNTDLIFMNKNHLWNTSLNKFFNYPMSMILILMIIYLLVTMIAIVKITNLNYGPLRPKL
uniref:NADH-ubiquinone oxidoreductase chain 6 n=1 Tax=Anthaxia chinensis TaxID=2853461 RepID=A0A8H2SGV0_9COLE|nr:NADH dehydrogenase subunit 6 [Anthaxia chinensis]